MCGRQDFVSALKMDGNRSAHQACMRDVPEFLGYETVCDLTGYYFLINMYSYFIF